MATRTALVVPALAFALAGSLLSARTARADVPPEPNSCTGKAKGDACTEAGPGGVCVADTCSRLDYSKGTPPSSVEYECLKCGPKPEAPAATPATPAEVPASAPAKKTGGCTIAADGGGFTFALLLLAVGFRRSRRVGA